MFRTLHPDEHITPLARKLRSDMTPEERHLWYDFLRTYPIKIRRQTVIDNYVADFYCAAARLAIELDGSQHYEAEGKQSDAGRTMALNLHEIKVIRFSNYDLKREFEGVCAAIDREIRVRLQFGPNEV